jgi:hypothetical protein
MAQNEKKIKWYDENNRLIQVSIRTVDILETNTTDLLFPINAHSAVICINDTEIARIYLEH